MIFRILGLLVSSLLAWSIPLPAEWYCQPQIAPYVKLTGGATFPCSLNVTAPEPVWSQAVEGFNSDFDARPMVAGAIGADIGNYAGVDLSVAYRGQFNYEKFQTPIIDGSIGPLTSTRTRHFNLDATSLMCSLYLYGTCFDCLNWQCASGSVYPVIGVGLGTSRLVIWDFRTTGLSPSSENNEPLLGFTAENQYYVQWRFTYQVSAGLEYRCGSWALGLGYRWFDAGRLGGPRYFRDKVGGSFDAGSDVWKFSLRSNEVYADLRFFF